MSDEIDGLLDDVIMFLKVVKKLRKDLSKFMREYDYVRSE